MPDFSPRRAFVSRSLLLGASLMLPAMTFADDLSRYRRARLPGGRIPNRPYTPSPDDAGWLLEDVWPPLYWGAESVPDVRRKRPAWRC